MINKTRESIFFSYTRRQRGAAQSGAIRVRMRVRFRMGIQLASNRNIVAGTRPIDAHGEWRTAIFARHQIFCGPFSPSLEPRASRGGFEMFNLQHRGPEHPLNKWYVGIIQSLSTFQPPSETRSACLSLNNVARTRSPTRK